MYICLLIGSILVLAFLLLFLSAGKASSDVLINCLCKNEKEKYKNLVISYNILSEKIKSTADKPLHSKSALKKLETERRKIYKKGIASKKKYEQYRKSGAEIYEIAPLAGYSLVHIMKLDDSNRFIAALHSKCRQFKENQDAAQYADYVVASLVGNSLLGVSLIFVGIGLGLALGLGMRSIAIGGALGVIFIILGLIPYSEVDDIIKKRLASIEHDFPRLVSKLALLTISGMELSRAWKLVSQSDTGVLYLEMERVNNDLANNHTHAEAYTKFIRRCNYSYTTKLGTAIMQNYTKGNAEIVKLLRELNNESWSEYKHTARRKGELIAGKLLIPTILLFIGIIILVIVPATSGFNI